MQPNIQMNISSGEGEKKMIKKKLDLSSLILQFPFSFSITLTTIVLGLLSSVLMLT